MSRPVVVLCCIFLCAGCELNSTWLDTTGQGRTKEQAQMDYGACVQAAEFPADRERNKKALNAALVAVMTCMKARGWKVAGYQS